jgi:hypothetical protein
MRIELLEADLRELANAGIAPDEAFHRGAADLGNRPTHEKPRERAGTPAGVDELIHLSAEAAADMGLLRFAYATKAGDYHRSREHHDAVESTIAELQREVVPVLRARLRELRVREAELEQALRARGVDPAPIGPRVPPGTAIDPTPKPGESGEDRLTLLPLPPRRNLLDRLLGRSRR